jgi:hypothetical protein
MEPPNKIEQPKLLLVEGADAYYFFIWACQAFGVNDVQVLDFGGISDLTAYLKTLPLIDGYKQVTAVAIARDAENDPLSAVRSVQHSLRQASLPIPNESFEFTGTSPRVAFMILPGFGTGAGASQVLLQGTLEDLCLDILKDKSNLECVDSYVECLQSKGSGIKRLHKTKLHSFLAGKDDFVGLKIGEASKAGAWDWNHSRLDKFKAIITTM